MIDLLHLLLTDGDVWDNVSESFPIVDGLLEIVLNGDRHRGDDILKPLIGLAYQSNVLVSAIFAMTANVGASILSYRRQQTSQKTEHGFDGRALASSAGFIGV